MILNELRNSYFINDKDNKFKNNINIYPNKKLFNKEKILKKQNTNNFIESNNHYINPVSKNSNKKP
jgi:hypothetical protein